MADASASTLARRDAGDISQDVLRRTYAAALRRRLARHTRRNEGTRDDAPAALTGATALEEEDVEVLQDVARRGAARLKEAAHKVRAAEATVHAACTDEAYHRTARVARVLAQQCAACVDGVMQQQLEHVRGAARGAARKATAWLRRLDAVHAAELHDMRSYAAVLQDRATQLYDAEDDAHERDDAVVAAVHADRSAGTPRGGGGGDERRDTASAALPGATQHAAGVYAQFLMAMRAAQGDHAATAREAARHAQDALLTAHTTAVRAAHADVEQAARDLRHDVRRAAHVVMTHMTAAQDSGAATYAHVDVGSAWRSVVFAVNAASDAVAEARGALDAEFALAVVRGESSSEP